MDTLYIIQYESSLRAKQGELIKALRDREGIEVGTHPDLFDEAQSAMDRAVLVQNLSRSSTLLHEVQAALERIAGGSYGECLNCGNEISPKRLRAAPWAALCLDCQEQADKAPKDAPDFDIAA